MYNLTNHVLSVLAVFGHQANLCLMTACGLCPPGLYTLMPASFHDASSMLPFTDLWNLYKFVSRTFVVPLNMTATVLQLILNHRRRTFAGQYKILALATALKEVIKLSAVFMPSGTMDSVGYSIARIAGVASHVGNKLTVMMLLNAVLAWFMAAQALWFPAVPQVDDESG
jgi:hypothetical protein